MKKNELLKRTFLHRSVDDLLDAVAAGKECNFQTHETLIKSLPPGTITRCPTCNQPLYGAPIKKH